MIEIDRLVNPAYIIEKHPTENSARVKKIDAEDSDNKNLLRTLKLNPSLLPNTYCVWGLDYVTKNSRERIKLSDKQKAELMEKEIRIDAFANHFHPLYYYPTATVQESYSAYFTRENLISKIRLISPCLNETHRAKIGATSSNYPYISSPALDLELFFNAWKPYYMEVLNFVNSLHNPKAAHVFIKTVYSPRAENLFKEDIKKNSKIVGLEQRYALGSGEVTEVTPGLFQDADFEDSDQEKALLRVVEKFQFQSDPEIEIMKERINRSFRPTDDFYHIFLEQTGLLYLPLQFYYVLMNGLQHLKQLHANNSQLLPEAQRPLFRSYQRDLNLQEAVNKALQAWEKINPLLPELIKPENRANTYWNPAVWKIDLLKANVPPATQIEDYESTNNLRYRAYNAFRTINYITPHYDKVNLEKDIADLDALLGRYNNLRRVPVNLHSLFS